MQKERGIKKIVVGSKGEIRENEMMRERKKVGEAWIEEGRGRALPEFPFHFSLGKEEQEKERGRISGRGSAGVVPPDLDWDTKVHSSFSSLLVFALLVVMSWR